MSKYNSSLGYAPVDLPSEKRVIIKSNGYGGYIKKVITDTKIYVEEYPSHLLQPLQGPFGNHLPENATDKYKRENPQTKLAWDTTHL